MSRRSTMFALAALLALAGCGRNPDVALAEDASPTAAPTLAVASEVSAPRRPIKLLTDAIGSHPLVLLGELHGTRETPALVGDLVQALSHDGRRIVLSLEITSSDQPSIDWYMASDGSPADSEALLAGSHWRDPMHDGRDSRAMLVLIERMRQLHAAGTHVSIDLFDDGGGEQRNKRMARHLRGVVRVHPHATVVVLTGNVHAMTSAPPWGMISDGKKIEPPMTAGRYLADLDPLSINIQAAGGEAWTCMGGNCSPHRVMGPKVSGQTALEWTDPSESAWDATLTLPEFTASPPAVTQ